MAISLKGSKPKHRKDKYHLYRLDGRAATPIQVPSARTLPRGTSWRKAWNEACRRAIAEKKPHYWTREGKRDDRLRIEDVWNYYNGII